jgi:hypothetical protein
MEHKSDSALALWNGRVINGEGTDARQLQMEDEPVVVPLTGPQRHNVRLPVTRLPVFAEGDVEHPHFASLFPDRICGENIEEMLDEMLDVILPLKERVSSLDDVVVLALDPVPSALRPRTAACIPPGLLQRLGMRARWCK